MGTTICSVIFITIIDFINQSTNFFKYSENQKVVELEYDNKANTSEFDVTKKMVLLLCLSTTLKLLNESIYSEQMLCLMLIGIFNHN